MTKETSAQYPTMSTAVLKAMSHPLRRQLLSALRIQGSGRAADLAEKLGEPANRLSFHLRTLADAGLITEAPELARDKRDRVWKPLPGPHTLGSPESPMSDRELGEAVLAGILDDHHGLLNRVAAFAERYSTGEDPEVRGVLNDATLRISRERFEELVGRFDALVEEYRDDVTTRPDEEHLGWQVLFAAASEEI